MPFALRRFDDQALIPPTAPADELAQLAAEAMALLPIARWCRQGDAPLAEAVLVVADPHRRRVLAQLAARQLDGSHRLASLRPLAGWWWRLQVLLADRHAQLPLEHPWDAGWASPDRAEHLGQTFVPRRPTLVLVDAGGLSDLTALRAACDALARRLPADGRVVRWLWLSDGESAARCAPAAAPRLSAA